VLCFGGDPSAQLVFVTNSRASCPHQQTLLLPHPFQEEGPAHSAHVAVRSTRKHCKVWGPYKVAISWPVRSPNQKVRGTSLRSARHGPLH
jgi:hypothetical protein